MDSGTLSDNVWSRADKIDGWLFREEAELLHRLNTGRWCEIGSWKGRSTFILAQRQRGYAIDWFRGIEDPDYELSGVDTLRSFLTNTADCRQNIVVVPMRFQDATEFINGPLDLLFLDAEHNYELTKSAFDLYGPLVAIGGHVVFHDAWGNEGQQTWTPLPEVTRFVKELSDSRPDVWRHTENVVRCAVFRRVR